MSFSTLLSLPYELRQQILRLSLTQVGTLELQLPPWTGYEHFRQPLFRTCKQLRHESLEAFYNGNTFLWIVGRDGENRSDPADYPLTRTIQGYSTISPVLPWQYPRMLQDLRHLHLNIYLPDPENEDAWSTGVRRSLSRLIMALEGGTRLRAVRILFTSKRVNPHIGLSSRHLDILNVLAKMEVPGKISVRTSYGFRLAKASIENLNLERMMRLGNM